MWQDQAPPAAQRRKEERSINVILTHETRKSLRFVLRGRERERQKRTKQTLNGCISVEGVLRKRRRVQMKGQAAVVSRAGSGWKHSACDGTRYIRVISRSALMRESTVQSGMGGVGGACGPPLAYWESVEAF